MVASKNSPNTVKLNLNCIKTYAKPYLQPATSLYYPFQSSILPAPPSTSKFYKVLWGLKIVRSSSPGITHRSCGCRSRWRRAGRSPKFLSELNEAAGRRWSLSAVLRCCSRRHRVSDPRVFEAAAQRSASKGACSNASTAGKSDQWRRGGGCL